MKLWTKYLPTVQTDVGTCPRSVALNAIRDAAIDFCESSKVWQDIQDPYPVGGGLKSYEFLTDIGVMVFEVRAAEMENQEKLWVRTANWCDDRFPRWRQGKVTGQPQVLTQIDPEHFILIPFPLTVSTCTLSVVLKPTRDSTKGPDFLFNDYYEAICSGAKARLMLMKGKEWTDPQAASLHLGLFNEKITEANVRRSKAFGRGKIRVESQFL